jgi:hypothetical protein
MRLGAFDGVLEGGAVILLQPQDPWFFAPCQETIQLFRYFSPSQIVLHRSAP